MPRVAAVVVVCLLALAACTAGDADDAAVIEQLRQAGADLSQPREVRYYLYLPGQADANRVATMVAGGARQVDVQPAAVGSDWLVLVTETTVVDLELLAARREEWRRALEPLGGEYDGWEAAASP